MLSKLSDNPSQPRIFLLHEERRNNKRSLIIEDKQLFLEAKTVLAAINSLSILQGNLENFCSIYASPTGNYLFDKIMQNTISAPLIDTVLHPVLLQSEIQMFY